MKLSDYLRREMFQGRRPRFFWLRAGVLMLLWMDGRACVGLFRVGQALHRKGWRRAAKAMEHYVIRRFGCTLHPNTRIGIGLRLPHPNGIVIGNDVVIGENCTIYQQVTLGGGERGDWKGSRFPMVGDDCILWSGSRIVGAVALGDGVVVGAGAVVIRDVPAQHLAVGVPAGNRPLKALTTGAAESPAPDAGLPRPDVSPYAVEC